MILNFSCLSLNTIIGLNPLYLTEILTICDPCILSLPRRDKLNQAVAECNTLYVCSIYQTCEWEVFYPVSSLFAYFVFVKVVQFFILSVSMLEAKQCSLYFFNYIKLMSQLSSPMIKNERRLSVLEPRHNVISDRSH